MKRDCEYSATKRNFNDYPCDWTVVELGDLLERVRRPVDVIPDDEYQEIGIRSHGKGLFYKEPVKGRDLGNKAVFWIEDGCLIINIIFAWEQAVDITTAREKGLIASHRFPMWRSKGNVDLQYLLSFFLTPLGKYLLKLASPGGAGRNKTLGQDEFNKIMVCIPSKIKEQQRIVQILSTWDRAIALEEQLIAEKKQQKKWLLQKLLTGKKRLAGFNLNWQQKTLGDCCEGNGLYGINAAATKFSEQLPRYLRITDIDVDGRYIENNNICVDSKVSYNYKLNINDIVFARTGASVGKNYLYNVNDGELIYAGYLIKFRINSQLADADFIKYVCNSKKYWDWVGVMSARSGQPGINADEYASFSFMCPPLPEQTAIAAILSTADREINLHEKHLEELKKQKKTLLQLLLTGIVRVNVQEVS